MFRTTTFIIASLALSAPVSAASQWVKGTQGRIRIEVLGDQGLPILFIHGNGSNHTQWTAQMTKLAHKHRVAAMDLCGFGESDVSPSADYSLEAMARDVAAVADALKFKNFVLVGHSLGGTVAATFAGTYPSRLAGLVMVDTSGDQRNLPTAALQQVRKGLAPETFEAFSKMMMEGALQGAQPETRSTVLHSLRATPRTSFVGLWEAALRFDPKPALATGPAIHIHSALFQANPGLAIHAGFPTMETTFVKGTSHWIHLDQPEEFHKQLGKFLEKVK